MVEWNSTLNLCCIRKPRYSIFLLLFCKWVCICLLGSRIFRHCLTSLTQVRYYVDHLLHLSSAVQLVFGIVHQWDLLDRNGWFTSSNGFRLFGCTKCWKLLDTIYPELSQASSCANGDVLVVGQVVNREKAKPKCPSSGKGSTWVGDLYRLV